MSPTPAPEHAAAPSAISTSAPEGPESGPLRWLRGDWEAPDVLLVVYEPEWRGSLGRLVSAAAHEAEVYVVVHPDDVLDDDMGEWLRQHDAGVLVLEHDTPWIRDYGPIEARDNGDVRWLDFHYWHERLRDDRAPTLLSREFRVPVETHSFMMDGGGLIGNGNGLCAMTATSFEDAGIATDRDASGLFSALGCRAVALLPPLPKEETGHADMIAQFLATDIVAVSSEESGTLPAVAEALDEAAEILVEAAAHMGVALEVVRLPLGIHAGVYYPYVNATALRRSYLVPSYRRFPRLEETAYDRLRATLPEMTLVPIPADRMAERGGAVHCMTLGLNVPRWARDG